MESSCRDVESRRSSLFCAVRLAMPFAKLSDRLDAQNAQIVSHRVLSRSGCSDVVFALYDREEIGPRMLARIDSDSQAGASTCRVEIINRQMLRDSEGAIVSTRAGCAPQIFFRTRCYFCGVNCPCDWRRPSAAALNSGLRCSAASNSGMLSLGFPDSRRAHPRFAWAAAELLGSSRTDS